MRPKPILLAIALAAAACAPAREPAEDALSLTPVAFADLPGWTADRHAEAIGPLNRSCAALRRAAGVWRPICAAAERLPPGDDDAARAFFERWFAPHLAAAGRASEGLFTGYYEPELRGSRVRSDEYRVPIYRRPPDLVGVDLGRFRPSLRGRRIAGRVVDGRLQPYPSRADIGAGALGGRGLELLWVDDAVDAFFLHVQGSGRVALAGGGVLRLGYAAVNGRPYRSIGAELIRRGAIAREDMSMQAIRSWLRAHPDRADALMNANPSFVFFRELEGDGPIGSQGVALTPGRSLAVDRRHVSLGLPVWLDATDPLDAGKPLRRLMIAQDTGGAIRGAVRGDVFWGHGAEAAARAGRMRHMGRYYLLLPRPSARPGPVS